MESQERRLILTAGALLTALGIALGAFGVHALRGILSEAALGWWQTGVQYQLWNAIGLVALAAAPLGRVRVSAWLIAAGTLIFAGSLYVMALTGMRWLGAVTPVGGVLMIAGWVCVGWSALRGRSAN
jgi:uncharacterized membrane protein YgdD (TMEM256/DUF423 family)